MKSYYGAGCTECYCRALFSVTMQMKAQVSLQLFNQQTDRDIVTLTGKKIYN